MMCCLGVLSVIHFRHSVTVHSCNFVDSQVLPSAVNARPVTECIDLVFAAASILRAAGGGWTGLSERVPIGRLSPLATLSPLTHSLTLIHRRTFLSKGCESLQSIRCGDRLCVACLGGGAGGAPTMVSRPWRTESCTEKEAGQGLRQVHTHMPT
jgi:hypothetical protein